MSRVYRHGAEVKLSLIFQMSSSSPSAAGSNIITGLPRAREAQYLVGADRQGHAVRLRIGGGGDLSLDAPRPSIDWYTVSDSYFVS